MASRPDVESRLRQMQIQMKQLSLAASSTSSRCVFPTDGGVRGHPAAAPEAAPVKPVEAGLVAAVEAAVGDGLPEAT